MTVSRSKKNIFVLLMVVTISMLLNGCVVYDYSQHMMADDATLKDTADPYGTHDYEGEVNKAREFYDEKTGEMLTKSQYYAYNFTDQFKFYGLYIVLISVAVGILLRVTLGRGSSALRRISTTMIIVVPIIYGILWYLFSLIADRVH